MAHAEIITTVDTVSYRYRVVVFLDGRLVDQAAATPGQVTRLRNRLCAEWSNRADSVHAGAIPRIPTLTNTPGEER